MSEIKGEELLYTITLNITGMKEYGVSFAALMAGESSPPVEGGDGRRRLGIGCSEEHEGDGLGRFKNSS